MLATTPKGWGDSPMHKVILVLVDGLRLDTAIAEMGFLEGAVRSGKARRWTMRAELPSLSRPLYETLHTGLPPQVHGVVSNDIVRPSSRDNLFSIASKTGLRTAAAAYSWFSELYNGVPYDPVMDRECDDASHPIQHGRFYTEDAMPDVELMRTGDMLARRFQPDYLLIHPMGCDDMGHRFGGASAAYRRAAAEMDNLLSLAIPGWRDAGYQVLVTSDHGMNADGRHGGATDDCTLVPFYRFGGEVGGVADGEVSQTAVAPTVLSLMGLPIPEAMTSSPIL